MERRHTAPDFCLRLKRNSYKQDNFRALQNVFLSFVVFQLHLNILYHKDLPLDVEGSIRVILCLNMPVSDANLFRPHYLF